MKWRVGNKIKLNVYCDDVPAFQCHTEEDAQRIVDGMNSVGDLTSVVAAAIARAVAAEREACAKRLEERGRRFRGFTSGSKQIWNAVADVLDEEAAAIRARGKA